MKCRNCIFMKPIGTNSLYICTNESSDNYMEYTGLLCEDECKNEEKEE